MSHTNGWTSPRMFIPIKSWEWQRPGFQPSQMECWQSIRGGENDKESEKLRTAW